MPNCLIAWIEMDMESAALLDLLRGEAAGLGAANVYAATRRRCAETQVAADRSVTRVLPHARSPGAVSGALLFGFA